MIKLNRVTAFMLATMLMSSTASFAGAMPTDIKGTNYEKAVEALAEAGAVTGDTDGNFYPESNLTRAQACVIIVKTIDPKASLVNGTATQPISKVSFTDLKGYSWASGYIAYAVEHGIVKGYPDGTFKPGVNVSTDEMLTMVLRAAGYTEDKIGANWPEDYITKAKEVGMFAGIDENYPAIATKGIAAQMTYNQMKELKAMAPEVKDEPQGTENDKAEGVPSTSGMVFTTASFDDNLTSFSGKPLSKGVEVYTYGEKKEYGKDMKLSEKADDFRQETIYKFKGAKTPAWYLIEDGKITKMILPRDTGFTGNVYCVINGTLKDVNASGEAVTGFETLTATKGITWFGKKGLNFDAFDSKNIADGQLYELKVSDGIVQNVATTAGAKGKVFVELTKEKKWSTISEYKNDAMIINDEVIGIRNNASIYVWDDKKKEYRSGNLSSIKSGKEVRAYDVSDDDLIQADVVILR
ncbi:MAG: S-layer homology domain-containing protein [Aminipila sp.]